MTPQRQKTLNRQFILKGKGLHSGCMVEVEVCPAEMDSGIRLVRTDLDQDLEMMASAQYAGDCARGSVLVKNGVTISTMEHLMSALHGMGVDNATVRLNGPEVPILDGSARIWVDEIKRVGLVEQEKARRVLTLSEPLTFATESGSKYVATPSDHFSVRCVADFGKTVIGCQEALLETMSDYDKEIAGCRTFVFLHDVLPLLQMGLIKGGDLQNALVFVDRPIDEGVRTQLAETFHMDPTSLEVRNGVLNTVEPYFHNEPARHKLLDFVGDILMVGCPVMAHFDIYCPGHKSNLALAQKLQEIYKLNL